MASQWKRLGYLLGLGVLVLPLIAACGPAAAPSPTPAPAAAPTKAAEPAKPAAATQEPYKIGFVNSFSGYMAAMGGQERDVVLMRVLGGLDTEDVARAVGKRAGNVRVIQSRAMGKLRAELIRRGYGTEGLTSVEAVG